MEIESFYDENPNLAMEQRNGTRGTLVEKYLATCKCVFDRDHEGVEREGGDGSISSLARFRLFEYPRVAVFTEERCVLDEGDKKRAYYLQDIAGTHEELEIFRKNLLRFIMEGRKQ